MGTLDNFRKVDVRKCSLNETRTSQENIEGNLTPHVSLQERSCGIPPTPVFSSSLCPKVSLRCTSACILLHKVVAMDLVNLSFESHSRQM
jgi:hypothetical protein